MKKRIAYCVSLLWTSLAAFAFPIAFGWIFLDITGHSKGYSYDLGPEKDISVMTGVFELIVWLVLTLPSGVYLFAGTAKKSKAWVLVLAVFFIALAAAGIAAIGGWREYLREVFNII